MRRPGVALVACVAAGAVGLTAYGGSTSARHLPLRSPRPATKHLLATIGPPGRFHLARVDPSTLRVVRTSAWRVGDDGGWVASPGGGRVAFAWCGRKNCDSSWMLRFANAATLRWESGAAPLDGRFVAGVWTQPGRLQVLVGGVTAFVLDTVDTATKKIVARTPVTGPLLQIARSADGLVALAGTYNTIVPARVLVIGSDGTVRSVTLQRILAGTHYDEGSQDLTGTTNLPALAVDPNSGTAYVVDPSGLVASVDLDTLDVAYHQLGSSSLLARIAGWLTPAAQAKGTNGSVLNAQWLGTGLFAVAGTQETATAEFDSYRPSGLRIVDTRNWSVRMLDPRADTFMVADGLLLATGTRSHFGNYEQTRGEGLAAYGPNGSLRWRVNGLGEHIFLFQAYRSLALVDGNGKLHLVDLDSGRIVHGPLPPAAGQLLLEPGSPTAPLSY